MLHSICSMILLLEFYSSFIMELVYNSIYIIVGIYMLFLLFIIEMLSLLLGCLDSPMLCSTCCLDVIFTMICI